MSIFLINKNKILKSQLFLLGTMVYISCSAPLLTFTGLVGLSAVSSLVLDDDKKPTTLVVEELRSSVIYETYMRELCQNIRDESKIRQATIFFINGLGREANKKLCLFYDLRPNNECRLTTAQMLIFIFCYVETPKGWDDQFKLNALLPLGLTSSSRVKAELVGKFSESLISRIISRMEAIPKR